MKTARNLELTFDAEIVKEAVIGAINDGLLCQSCVYKIETQHEIAQADFCPACQATINSLLNSIVGQRIQEILTRKGLRRDLVEVVED